MLLLLCASSIILFFLIPIYKTSLVLFSSMLTLVFFSIIFVDIKSLYYGELLYLYIAIEAAFFVQRHSFYIILGVYTIFSVITLFIHDSLTIESVLAVGFMSALLYLLWRKIGERAELFFVHNEVILEYRQLKRKALENESMARLEERTRISREIHDSVGHKLTAVLMQLEMMSMEVNDPRLVTIKKEVRDSLEEIRLAVRTLNQDEAAGLTSVLQLIRKLETESHISINFTTKHGILSAKLSNDQSIVLYRVLQEALTNAMRYAASREVMVTLGRTAVGHFHINIQNRINNAQPFQPGFGLQNMRERLDEIGGSVQAYQTEGFFIVDASFPLKGDGL
ncbi:sensor histidine kinase [Cytobacillus dafuensis]|uniref:histidine kinase n=1 Tax=Cytobacillus dafuensis TaxID=1742359 RepID=A0A5B8YZU4_CYTDA|nr:sensor histidine kinase [Cytobacillus dafuensis]